MQQPDFLVKIDGSFLTVLDDEGNTLAQSPLLFSPEGSWSTAVIAETEGDHGERRFALTLRNTGEKPLTGPVYPPFSAFALEGALPAYSPEYMMIVDSMKTEVVISSPTLAHIGGIGALKCHSIGGVFYKCVFSVNPAGERYVCALLRMTNGEYPLPPGGEAEYELIIHSAAGDRNDALEEVFRRRGAYAFEMAGYDYSHYDRLPWIRDALFVWMNWAWDRSVMEPSTGEYRLAHSLKALQADLGKIDLYVLWPFWPRAGLDERLQFDHYRSFPGGLAGLQEEIRRVQALGVRVVAAYCYWSEYDRFGSAAWESGQRESFQMLLETGAAIGADGFDMDCMDEIPNALEELSRKTGKQYLPYNEGDPGLSESQVNLLGRIHDTTPMPAFNLKRFVIPHHPILRVTGPGLFGKRMRGDIALSLFDGHGIEINAMFGENDPDCAEDWQMLKKALFILRSHRENFCSPAWRPFIQSLDQSVWINQWPGKKKTVYTLCGTSPLGRSGALLRLPHREDVHYVDLYNNRMLKAEQKGDFDILGCDIAGYTPGLGNEMGNADYSPGCIGVFFKRMDAALWLGALTISIHEKYWQDQFVELYEGEASPAGPFYRAAAKAVQKIDLYPLLGHSNRAIIVCLSDGNGQIEDQIVLRGETVRLFIKHSLISNKTKFKPGKHDMISVPGGEMEYRVTQSQPIWQYTYVNTFAANATLYGVNPPFCRKVRLEPFLIARHNVTNAEYMAFVRETGYAGGDAPDKRAGFLRHLDEHPLEEIADHPVVCVSFADAAAYCAWAGLRLPSEVEWQMAAGFLDGRVYPWGNAAREDFVNQTGTGTIPTGAIPAAKSPFGLLDLVGNVWQYTNDILTNGAHDVVYLRGGSWLKLPDSDYNRWWIHGGARRIDDHVPMPLFGPSMNRLSTVGFRCAADAYS